jgi:hypothetical protein
MASLRWLVADFVSRVKASPADGSDPRLLARLSKAAEDSWDGAFATLAAPMAPLTWEVNALFPSSQPETQRIPFKFPWPVEIVGFRPSIISTDAAGIAPTLEDVQLELDANLEKRPTAGQGVTTTVGGKDGTFVTLAAMGIQTPRLTGLRLTNASPDLGFTFRWKRGANVYNSALVSVAMYCRPLARD